MCADGEGLSEGQRFALAGILSGDVLCACGWLWRERWEGAMGAAAMLIEMQSSLKPLVDTPKTPSIYRT